MADETANPQPAPETDQTDKVAPTAEPEQASVAAEVSEIKDKLLRTLAEMENLRRRTERELTDTRQYAVANFARDMLTVGDNLRRAIGAVPPEARSADPALSNLMDGVEATERLLDQALKRHGIREIGTKGEKFDPMRHQAIYQVERGELGPGMVAEVVQAGYTIGDRVLRPAMVAVSKAASPGAPAAANDDAPDKAERESADQD